MSHYRINIAEFLKLITMILRHRDCKIFLAYTKRLYKSVTFVESSHWEVDKWEKVAKHGDFLIPESSGFSFFYDTIKIVILLLS